MDEAKPSRTALRVALRRAAHQLYDSPPLVFPDPLAVRILGPHAAELERTPGQGRRPALVPRTFSLGLRAFLVARSRYAEDLLAAAVARPGQPVTQYVLLGAGLDTFAHRNSYPGLRVFEVDHPATQAWKRDLLALAALPAPPALHYAPVDFERGTLAAGLAAAGFDLAQPALFAWLGVVPYLTLDAFRATLHFIGQCAPGSGVVFDYGLPREALPLLERMAHDSLAARVASAGEPFRLFLLPEEAAAELAAAGLNRIEDLGAAGINARWFADRTDQLRIRGSAGRLVSAWVR